MEPLRFFDANAWVGTPVFDPRAGACTRYSAPEDLLAAMDFYGVQQALVSHYRCLFGDPMKANRLLAEELAGSPRLFPCWTLLPHQTGEAPGGRELSAELRRHRVRAVRLAPGPYNLVFRERLLRGLLEVLERERILTIVELPTLGVPVPDKEDVLLGALEEVLDRHPRLALLTCGRLRNFYPLLERFPNLLSSLAWDPHPDFVEDFCRRFDARRLLFATPYSENARGISGMPMLQVTHAGVGGAQKARIAGGNLAELLGVEQPPLPAGAEPRPGLRELLAGGPSPFPIVDIHAHVGAWNWEFKPSSGLAQLQAVMDRLGVERACVNSTEAVLGGDHLRGNEELAAELRGRKDRFAGFAVINPHFAELPSYLRGCVEDLGFRGFKIHPRVHRCAITDPKYRPVWEASARLGVPVLCHTGQGQAFSEPDQFAGVAAEHPAGRFILGHTGETFAGLLQCIELANRHPNLYLDSSGWLFMNRGYLEYLVPRVDPGRILFGSDFSWIDLRYAAATVLFAGIDDRAKARILAENARAILPQGGRSP
jgi:predicted TIM-barrel fold metal-dependent hydrolase